MRLQATAICVCALIVLVGCATSERTPQSKHTKNGNVSAVSAQAKAAPVPSGPPATDPTVPKAGPVAAPTDSYADAAKYLSEGQVDKAIGIFERLVQEKPDDIESQVQFARLLMSANRLKESRSVLDRVLERAPDNPDAAYAMALLDGAQGKTQDEQKRLESIVAAHPENADANATLGQLYMSANNVEKARAAFEKSLKADPSNITALLGDGDILLYQDNKPKEALARFDRAIKLQPELSFAYGDRAEARVRLDDIGGAEKDLSRAISLNPTYYWHYIDRGKLRLKYEQDRKGALADFNKAISLRPDYFLGYVYRGGLYDSDGKDEKALSDYRELLKLRPDYYFVYQPYAILLYVKHEWSRAREYFLKAFKSDPTDYGYQLVSVITYLKQKDTADANGLLKRMVAELPHDSPFYDLARVYLQPGYDAQFLVKLKTEKNPDVRTRMLFYLACYYELHGKNDLAQRYFLDVQSRHVEGMWEYRLNEAELAGYHD